MSQVAGLSQTQVSNEFSYRPTPPLAPTVLLTGILSASCLITEFAIPIGLLGLLLGAICLRQINRSRGEYGGGSITRIGMVLCVLFIVSGTILQAYLYAVEVPEGYARVSFVNDVSRAPFVFRDGVETFSDDVQKLDGQQVFLKGYIYPDGRQEGIRNLILCKDSGECCFGGQPKLTDMIEVVIPEGVAAVDYTSGLVSVAGTFSLGDLSQGGQLSPVFQLEATHFHRARSIY